MDTAIAWMNSAETYVDIFGLNDDKIETWKSS